MTAVDAKSVERLAAEARGSVVPQSRRSIIPAAQAALANGPQTAGAAYDLYHFGFSICSNKVRAVLFELDLVWRSLELDPNARENYKPQYVRLRLASAIAQTTAFAQGWEGGSSVAEAGFDALAVPTLVDNANSNVVADSLQICLHLARSHATIRDLLPADLEADVLEQLDAVDRTPHVALLYGANPDGDGRALVFRRGFKTEHAKKAEAARRHAEAVRGEDAKLDAAYAAKIAKESAGSAFVSSPKKMRAAIADVDRLIERFAETLDRSGGPWIFGERYTLADTFWAVSLFRLQFLGYGWLYRRRPERTSVARYTERAFARPSIIGAIGHWPRHPWSQPAARHMREPTIKDRLLALGSHETAPAAAARHPG